MNKTMLNSTKLLGVTILLTASTGLLAVESVTSTATVTVQNSFTFAETSPIDFGTIRAKAVATGTTNGAPLDITGAGVDVAILVLLSSDGTSSVTDGATASVQGLVPGAAGVYSISGVAPFSS